MLSDAQIKQSYAYEKGSMKLSSFLFNTFLRISAKWIFLAPFWLGAWVQSGLVLQKVALKEKRTFFNSVFSGLASFCQNATTFVHQLLKTKPVLAAIPRCFCAENRQLRPQTAPTGVIFVKIWRLNQHLIFRKITLCLGDTLRFFL